MQECLPLVYPVLASVTGGLDGWPMVRYPNAARRPFAFRSPTTPFQSLQPVPSRRAADPEHPGSCPRRFSFPSWVLPRRAARLLVRVRATTSTHIVLGMQSPLRFLVWRNDSAAAAFITDYTRRFGPLPLRSRARWVLLIDTEERRALGPGLGFFGDARHVPPTRSRAGFVLREGAPAPGPAPRRSRSRAKEGESSA